MDEEATNPAPEAATEAAPEAPPPITVDSITSAAQMRDLFNREIEERTRWAQERIQQTGYQQAVQAELALHRTDLATFTFNVLFNLLLEQKAALAEAEGRIANLSLAVVNLTTAQLVKSSKKAVKVGV